MKRAALLVILGLFSSAVSAAAIVEYTRNLADIDTTKYCVYAEQAYSLGAMILVGEQMLECIYFSDVIDNVPPGARWDRAA